MALVMNWSCPTPLYVLYPMLRVSLLLAHSSAYAKSEEGFAGEWPGPGGRSPRDKRLCRIPHPTLWECTWAPPLG